MDAHDDRTVTIGPAATPSQAITLSEAEVWWVDSQQSHGVRLPEGTYTVEGEDGESWYFRAPTPLDIRFNRPGPDNERLVPGGIALRKHPDLLLVAEIYILGHKGDPQARYLIQKLGRDFGDMEKDKWTRNF